MSNKKPETGARLFIGGFPRNTTKNELEEFCSRFGKVKNTDLIPFKQLAFVTFTSKEEATLAMFGIQKQTFKGSQLRVDWAKERQDRNKDSKERDLKTDSNPAEKEKEKEKDKDKAAKDVKDVKDVAVERYIPGDTKEAAVAVSPRQGIIQVTEDIALSAGNVPEEVVPAGKPAFVEPVKLLPIPNLIARMHYPESSPPLEITIRDFQTHDIKYTFRVKSLAHLKNYLIAETNGEIAAGDLFHTSAQKLDKNLFYGGIPVVHIYEDLLGKEQLEPRENKEKRENFLKSKNAKNNRDPIPKAEVPLSSKRIPVEEVYHLLATKGYEYVLLNTSANGPTAPLHPDWKPLPNTYMFRKGGVLVTFSGQTYVESFQFLNQNTNQYKDLLPILVKYDVCIFNSNKGAFITPEQLQ